MPERRRTYWQVTLSAIPIVAALVSTSLLAYFMLFSERPYLPCNRSAHRNTAARNPKNRSRNRGCGRRRRRTLLNNRNGGRQSCNSSRHGRSSPTRQTSGLGFPCRSDAKLLILITSSLLALNQANATANYTVLWDSAAPAFQQTNSPEHLAEVFNDLRARNLDLSPIVLHQPRLFRRPEMNEQGMIRVTGFFPTEPDRVNFDLIYQPVQGKWRLVGMAVDTSPAPAQPEAAAPPQAKNAPSADNPESVAETPTETSEAKKPPAPSRKPKDKPKATQEAGKASQSAKPKIDVRDRIDNPPKPEPEKPKESGWNPFGR